MGVAYCLWQKRERRGGVKRVEFTRGMAAELRAGFSLIGAHSCLSREKPI